MKPWNLLVVDDDPLILQSMRLALPDTWRMNAVDKPDDIPDNKIFHAAMVDMHLTGNLNRAEGVDVIRELVRANPHLDVVAMSGDLDRQLMEKCLKAGANRFLAKPLSLEEVQLTLGKIEAWLLLQDATGRHQTRPVQWIGSSPLSQQVKRQIADFKGESGPILIEGESGTGKEVAATLIHQQADDTPFIAVNVAALPDNLFESELFGHVRGAFTGADQNKMGLVEAAHGGDLFLDEIEALSLSLQVKLLRFLESGEVRRVGSNETIQVKTRVILATNRNLEQMVKEGSFREDLLWRISGKKLSLPPLRQRTEDLAELVRHFLEQERVRKKELSDEALQLLAGYSWPGNVRELRRAVEQLVLLSPLPVIRREDVTRVMGGRSQGATSDMVVDYSEGLTKIVEGFEAGVIKSCLEQHDDVDEVSRILKISRSSLYKKIKDYQIDWRGA